MERLFNVALGLSIVGWGVQQVGPSVVAVTLAALNVAVGLLIIIRRREMTGPTLPQVAMALPAVAISAAAVALAPRPATWPILPAVALVTGCVLTLVSFAYLGRSFAVLPSLRRVVVNGPYRIVRHPAYLGELVMLGACAFAAGHPAWGILPVAAGLVLLRIDAEEQVLSASSDYQRYREATPARLIPWLF